MWFLKQHKIMASLRCFAVLAACLCVGYVAAQEPSCGRSVVPPNLTPVPAASNRIVGGRDVSY